MRHGGNGSQRFTAKAHGLNGFKTVLILQLGSGMPEECNSGVFRRHAAAIVGNADHRRAAVQYFDRDIFSPGIKGIFHQFLDHGCRAFDHLTGSDEIGNMRAQQIDLRHRNSPLSPCG